MGRTLAVGLAGGGVLGLLVSEWSIRDSGVVAAVTDAVVIGGAVWLAMLSGLLFAAAVMGRRGFAVRWSLPDDTRRALVWASQAAAVATWVHLYLCRQDWATSALAGHWPWVVLGIATASVVAAVIARRAGDAVLTNVLGGTSLYLPLVPAMGFWATRSEAVLSFLGSRPPVGDGTPYQWILLAAALYYVVSSTVWKSAATRSWTRAAAMLFGTGALWLELSEHAGWAFFTHPQAWLVPPAVGVLVMTHLERERLPSSAVSSLRYAATLVIYVTSTADMIFAGLGNDLIGPMVLITLSLIGIATGIYLRIGPLVLLGSLFTFIAMAGMVAHAGQSLDAVWPWWAFGIGTGVMVLGALVTMERHRDRWPIALASSSVDNRTNDPVSS